jgi:hypothetical protein
VSNDPHDAHHDAHDAHDAHHDAHDAHDAHGGGHDEPLVDPPLAADEQPTPAWLTAIGAALFVAAGIWWLVSGPPDKTLKELSPAPADSAAAAPAAH